MLFSRLLVSSVAVAAVAIALPALTKFDFVPAAVAATANVDVSFAIFYDGLANDGDWVSLDDEYVFVPARTGPRWKPYTEGHWIYAKRYGWTWVSDEPFGWATYHYGRWGYTDEVGWYWVPGTRWAPAWVSWKRSKDHVAWAPLPAHHRKGKANADVTVEISNADVPDNYWVAVPAPEFLALDLNVVVISDDDDRDLIIRDAEFLGVPRVENNIVINTVIDIDFIRKSTNKEVREVEVKEAKEPSVTEVKDGEVTAFTGEIAPETDAKPAKITEIEEVKQKVKTEESQQTGDTKAPATDTETDQAADPAAEDKTKTDQAQDQKPADAVKTDDQAAAPGSTVNKTDDATTGADQTGKTAKPEDQAAQPGEAVQPVDKTKKKTNASEDTQPDAKVKTEDQAAKPDDKKKKKADEAKKQPADTLKKEDQAAEPGKKDKKAKAAKDQKADDATGSVDEAPAAKAGKKKASDVTEEKPTDAAKPAESVEAKAGDKKKKVTGQDAGAPAAKPEKSGKKKAIDCDVNTNPDCAQQ